MARAAIRSVIVVATLATMLTGCSSAGTDADRSGSAGNPTSAAASDRQSPSGSATTAASSPAGTASAAGTAAPSARHTAGTAKGSASVQRTIATGLNVPWGLALLPGGDLLVTSRDDHTVSRINLDTGNRTTVATIDQAVSNVTSGGEAGLLGIALSPDFSSDHRLYLYYSTAEDNRIARFDYDADRPAGKQLTGRQVILSGIPLGLHHNGGRIAFGPDGMLYAATGEAGDSELAQQKSSLGGKILRMTAAGRPAPGNPYLNSAGPKSFVWSYGHRNVQGLAWDPAGRMWASEFGDRTADELNLIKADHNYGWPATQGRTTIDGYTSPVAQWGTEDDSPSGIAYAAGSVWMAALRGERLWRIPLKGDTPVAQPTDFLTGTHGRLRSVLALTDHTLLVTTSNTDGRGTPKKSDDRILLVKVS